MFLNRGDKTDKNLV